MSSFPSIIFFRKNDSKPSPELAETLLDNYFLPKGAVKRYEYGPISEHQPERGSPILKIHYSREAYILYELNDSEIIKIHWYRQLAFDKSFEETHVFSFVALKVNFEFKIGWNSFRKNWFELTSVLCKELFDDVTLKNNFSKLHNYFEEENDPTILIELDDLAFSDAINNSILHESKFSVQNNPTIDIPKVLDYIKNKEKIQSIQITNVGLNKIPEELRKFPNLRYLYIYRNDIKEIPDWIGDLKELISINLHTTPACESEEQVEKLKSLVREDCKVIYF